MSGLEVVGAIASVVQLAQVVHGISKSLYEVGNALANASSDILDLAHDLEIFSEELHLHATLVNAANHRYSDQVNRLTAKIIDRCATICGKIDRILKKLRTGGVWAKVKWLYKEKELKKLLERLRDLKLSLMGTLSHLRTLKADYMMDTLGVSKPSLLQGREDEEMSKATMEDIEEARRKLAGLGVRQRVEHSTASKFQQSARSSGTTQKTCTDNSLHYRGSHDEISSRSTSSTLLSSVVSLPPETIQLVDSPFVSTIYSSANPEVNHIFGNPKARDSVQSFHSALTYQPDKDQDTAKELFLLQPPIETEGFETSRSGAWMADMVCLAIKHFSMSPGEARDWALSLPAPTKGETSRYSATSGILQPCFPDLELGPSASSTTMSPPHSSHGADAQELIYLHKQQTEGVTIQEAGQRVVSAVNTAFTTPSRSFAAAGTVYIRTDSIGGNSASPQSPAQRIENIGPDEQRTLAQMDTFEFPPVFRTYPAMPQGIHPTIKTWGQLKGWVAHNPRLGPYSLESITALQRLHYQEMVRSRMAQSQTAQIYPGVSNQIGAPTATGGFELAPLGTPIAHHTMSVPLREIYVHKPDLSDRFRTPTSLSLYDLTSSSSASFMEIPPHGTRPVALPEIYVRDLSPSDRFHNSRSSSSYNSTSFPSTSSIPMSIPHSRIPVPPPCPVPRHLAHIAVDRNDRADIACQWKNPHEDKSDWGRSIGSVQPHSSEGFAKRKSGAMDERPDLPYSSSEAMFNLDTNLSNMEGILVKNPSLTSLDDIVFTSKVEDKAKNEARRYNDKSSDRNSPPWKCPVESCKYHEYGWPTKKEMDRHYIDMHSTTPPLYECHFKPCPYRSKRESNCKQHMEKAHGWTFVRSKNHGKNRDEASTLGSSYGFLSSVATPEDDDFTPCEPFYLYEPLINFPKHPSEICMTYPGSLQLDSSLFPNPSTNESMSGADFLLTSETVSMAEYNPSPAETEALEQYINAHTTTPICPPKSLRTPTDISSFTTSFPRQPPSTLDVHGSQHKGAADNDFPNKAQRDQLWCRAFLKMQEENPTNYGSLLAAWSSCFACEAPLLDEDNGKKEIERLQNEIRERVDFQFRSSVTAPWSVLGSFDQILEILEVVRSTVGFKIGVFGWICFCTAVKSQLYNKSSDEINEQQVIISALADLATIIARYTVMENMFQNWPGMSLEPAYEDSLVSLCSQILKFFEWVLSNRDPLNFMVWAAPGEMTKINEADAICRAFKVTILQDQSSNSEDNTSEEDSESDGTLEESPKTKRRIEDISAESPDSDSTEVGCKEEEVMIEGLPCLKRVRVKL